MERLIHQGLDGLKAPGVPRGLSTGRLPRANGPATRANPYIHQRGADVFLLNHGPIASLRLRSRSSRPWLANSALRRQTAPGAIWPFHPISLPFFAPLLPLLCLTALSALGQASSPEPVFQAETFVVHATYDGDSLGSPDVISLAGADISANPSWDLSLIHI